MICFYTFNNADAVAMSLRVGPADVEVKYSAVSFNGIVACGESGSCGLRLLLLVGGGWWQPAAGCEISNKSKMDGAWCQQSTV